MDVRYHYNHKPVKHRKKRALVVLGLTLLVLGLITAGVYGDIRRNQATEVSGKAQTILQSNDDTVNRLRVDEPLFVMDLPGDWKELKRQNDQTENSITWQSTKPGNEGRTLKLYIDIIPASLAVNRLLPVVAQGHTIVPGDLSENCATFTQGGTLNAHEAAKLKETPAKWNKTDFICDLPRVNDNRVGTGSPEGVNTVTVTGPAKGPHKYFFLYTEQNIQPSYQILSNAVRGFRAK